ncbi:MAG: WD40/YVTN/BNR-like repeat-containing protein [Dehalococcoidia bacterium]
MSPSLNLALLAGAADGLWSLLPGDQARRVVATRDVRALDARGDVALAGSADGAWLHRKGKWEQVLEADVRCVRVSPDGVLVAGVAPSNVLASEDRGETWREWGTLQNLVRYHGQRMGIRGTAAPVAGVAFASGIIVAFTGIGAFLTLDDGRTWALHSEGLDRRVHGLWEHPERSERLYAAAPSGFYRSEDGGYSWVQSLHGLDRSWASDVAVLPGVPDTLLLTAARSSDRSEAALFRSVDGAVSWTRFLLGDRDEWPQPPLVTSLTSPVDALFILAGGEVWGSHDRGERWIPMADGLPEAQCFLAAVGEW